MTTTKPQSTTETLEPTAPERVTLWICCHCRTPRMAGLSVCERCGKRLHDAIEYQCVPASAAPVVDALVRALEKIQNHARPVCECEHDNEYCCAVVGEFCALCWSYVALRDYRAAAATAAPVEQSDELVDEVHAERQAAAIVTIWRAIKDHDDKLLVRYIKRALLEWQPTMTNSPSTDPSTCSGCAAGRCMVHEPIIRADATSTVREAAEEISSTFGLKLQDASLAQVAAIIKRHYEGAR